MTVGEFLNTTTLPVYAFDRMSSFFIAAINQNTTGEEKALFTDNYGSRRLYSYYTADNFIIIHI